MNPLLAKLQPYPFERLRALFQHNRPNPALSPINLGIGEPRHPTPPFIEAAMSQAIARHGLATYPATAGELALREAFAAWLHRRYGLNLNPATQMLPVNGSREALFAFAQTIVHPDRAASQPPLVVCPNPFYQIYEGAALLAGAQTYLVASDPARNFAPNWDAVPDAIWARTQLLFVCSPHNPTGAVMPLADWAKLLALSLRFGFVIASDECYSEIYFGPDPPLGGLQAAQQLGHADFKNLVCFTSLSKRSNVPGLRSGFCAGDAALIQAFLHYRTYHGSAMSAVVQAASIAAWQDEAHVAENRAQYQRKFHQITPLLAQQLEVALPDAGFYLWAATPGDDAEFARELHARYNVTVLPGSYLARTVQGHNPGARRIRLALVADGVQCLSAAQRILEFTASKTASRAATPITPTPRKAP